MATKAITDEHIVAALLTNGTIKQAAESVGLSERTIYERMNGGEFQALYKAAKADLIRGAVFSLNGKLQEAINTVADIMANDENNPAVRLQAAQTILNTAGKFMQRLQDSENDTARQVDSNRFNFFNL